MRSPGPAVLSLFAVAAVAAAAAFAVRPDGVKPSVVLFTFDTTRADRLGCYGYAGARTPNLDRLASEGALFEDCASSSPLTLPSHATILTGYHPPRHGLRDNDTPHPLPPAAAREFRTGAEVFRDGGYATAAFLSGAPLARRWGLDAGFDVYDAPEGGEPGERLLDERDAGATADRVLAWLASRDRHRPFFLWVHLFDPHAPYRAPGGSGAPPDSSAAYDEEVAHADAHAGRVLDALRAEGILDRTVVVACADHGEGLGDHGEPTHGYFLHRSTIRVPLLVRYPPRVGPGRRVAEPAGLVDVLPTILDLARRGPPARPLDGRPLLSTVPAPDTGGADGRHQYAETLYGWRAFRWAQSVSLRDGGLRVIDHGGNRRELYDLASDPGEAKDLSRTEAARPEAARAAETAWSLFTSPALLRADPPAVDPGLGSIGYVSAYSPVQVRGSRENGALPLPSASFAKRFDTALRALDRARSRESEEEAAEDVAACLAQLQELDREDPENPAVPFWMGRAYRQRGKSGSTAGARTWLEAFLKFTEAGRRGYREARTVSLMLEAAHHAQEYRDMLKAARQAVEKERMDGDASFWGWVALAWIEGGVEDGRLPPAARAAARDALDKAQVRSRSEAESRRIRELESLLK